MQHCSYFENNFWWKVQQLLPLPGQDQGSPLNDQSIKKVWNSNRRGRQLWVPQPVQHFGTLKLQQIIIEQDNLWDIPEDALGNILHDEYIAQWQERSWIYEAIVNSLNNPMAWLNHVRQNHPAHCPKSGICSDNQQGSNYHVWWIERGASLKMTSRRWWPASGDHQG